MSVGAGGSEDWDNTEQTLFWKPVLLVAEAAFALISVQRNKEEDGVVESPLSKIPRNEETQPDPELAEQRDTSASSDHSIE